MVSKILEVAAKWQARTHLKEWSVLARIVSPSASLMPRLWYPDGLPFIILSESTRIDRSLLGNPTFAREEWFGRWMRRRSFIVAACSTINISSNSSRLKN